jgi:hypothetical protein
MKKYAILLVLSIFGFSSCIEIASTFHDLFINNKTGKDIRVFYVLSREKETVEMQVADGSGFNIRIKIPGDQSAYSEEDLDLVFDKISFYDGKDTVLVDLEKSEWRKNKSGADWKFRLHSYALDLTK